MKRKVLWIIFGSLTLLIRSLVANQPQFVENYYSRGLFVYFRQFWDTFFTWVSFPLIYAFVLLFAAFWIRRFFLVSQQRHTWTNRLKYFLLDIAAFVLGGVAIFLWIWGFNYSRLSIEEQLGLKLEPVTEEELKAELEREFEALVRLRTNIKGLSDSVAFSEIHLPLDYENQIRLEVEDWLSNHNIPVDGRVRGRELYPKGIFLHFSSSGLYFPFTGEGHVDAGVHPLQKPYIIAHEMAHGYGFGDEGTCSFLGFVACIGSKQPEFAYAGHLNYYRTVAANYARADREAYRNFHSNLPLGIRLDLEAIYRQLAAYPDWMPKLRYYVYDSYLKAQGIKEGIKNYNRVLMLVKAWRNENQI